MYKVVYVGGGGYTSVCILVRVRVQCYRVLWLQYVHMFQCWHGIGVFTWGQIEKHKYYWKYYANMAKVGIFRPDWVLEGEAASPQLSCISLIQCIADMIEACVLQNRCAPLVFWSPSLVVQMGEDSFFYKWYLVSPLELTAKLRFLTVCRGHAEAERGAEC